MKILEFHVRITKNMKILEKINAILTKIIKIIKLIYENHADHEHPRIQCENNKNHESHRITLENLENHEVHVIP